MTDPYHTPAQAAAAQLVVLQARVGFDGASARSITGGPDRPEPHDDRVGGVPSTRHTAAFAPSHRRCVQRPVFASRYEFFALLPSDDGVARSATRRPTTSRRCSSCRPRQGSRIPLVVFSVIREG